MKCSRCDVTVGSLINGKCKFCRNEGIIERILWEVWPRRMFWKRMRQNLRNCGWLK
ncbi:MAG: hypothetical protein JRD89_15580 [Deltaproteobacteria bacterium]|nr:hypothetical protein [Deltaproteobacteria bacterium]